MKKVKNIDDQINRFDTLSQKFLARILSASPPTIECIEKVVDRANRAQRAAFSSTCNILGCAPALGAERLTNNYPHATTQPLLKFAGFLNEQDTGHNFALRVLVSLVPTTPLRVFPDADVWWLFLPKWAKEGSRSLDFISDEMQGDVELDFCSEFTARVQDFHDARKELEVFLVTAQSASLRQEHVAFIIPNYKILFGRNAPSDSFKRRPRKIAAVPVPSPNLLQCMALLTTVSE